MPASFSVDSKPFVEHHPLFGYAYRPGACMTLPTPDGGTYTIRINRQGIRSDREFAPDIPHGRFRWLVVGDSVAAGQYCDNADRFTERLEARCDGLECMNLALEGTGTDQQLLLLREAARTFAFDAILVCPYLENIRRNIVDYRESVDAQSGRRVLTPKPRFELHDDRLVLCNVPVPERRPAVDEADPATLRRSNHPTGAIRLRARANRWLEGLGIKRLAYRWLPHDPFPEYRSPRRPAWRLMEAILREIVTLAARRPVVIAPQVYYGYLEHRFARHDLARFRSLTRIDNVQVVDILPYLRGLPPADRRACYWSDDCHLTPFGHRIAAESIHAELGRIGLLPSESAHVGST